MWYDASSVIEALKQCKNLTFIEPSPSCPKMDINAHCHQDFPDCIGKTLECHQSLKITNEKGNPSILHFDYYVSANTRNGRIKKLNSTLCFLIKRDSLNENLMVSL